MNPLKKVWYVFGHLGPRFVWVRSMLAVQKRLGHDRRVYRSRPWNDITLADICNPGVPTEPSAYAAYKRERQPPFLFPLGEPPSTSRFASETGQRRPDLAERVRLLEADRCVWLFAQAGSAPHDWYTNDLTGGKGNADQPWYEVADFSESQGDIRTLWDPARAAWAIDLARASARDSEAPHGETFWRWVDSWMTACPAYMGTQWKCGQEASVRMIALTLGFWSLADDPATTPERWVDIARIAHATGHRVMHHLSYAVSQKNNHALSEACGLMLIGQLFPEFRDAERWRATGRRVIDQELRRQIYDDGSYVQHSMNYQRVMLHVSILALRLAEVAGDPFDRELYERLGRAGDFLYEMMEPANGRLPNYGNNDGACVLPLSECDFSDFRGVIQATHFLVHRKRRLDCGPWDEELAWLFGNDALDAPLDPPQSATSVALHDGGYYTLRQQQSWAMVRCHSYRDRPAHRDALHVDLWWKGCNVLQDCGTYQYFTPGRPDQAEYFQSIAAHNTVQISEREPIERISHFTWFPWPNAQLRHHQSASDRLYFEGQSNSYDRAPWHAVHRRAVMPLGESAWLIVDDLLGSGPQGVTLRWHLAAGEHRLDRDAGTLRVDTSAGEVYLAVCAVGAKPQLSVAMGCDEPGRVQGFASRYYGLREPIPTLEAVLLARLPVRLLTVVGLGGAVRIHATSDEHCYSISDSNIDARVTFSKLTRDAERIVENVELSTPSGVEQ